jgi:AraC-like DNA-binding protein
MFHPPAAYHEFTPSPDLAPFVKCYGFLEYDLPESVTVTNHFLPFGHPYLVISYRGKMWNDNSPFRREEFSNCHIAGQLLQHYYHYHSGDLGTVAIYFQPTGFNQLFGLPMTELTQNNIGVREFFGADGEPLISRISSMKSTLQKINAFEDMLRAHSKKKQKTKDSSHWAVQLIQENPRQSVDEVCANLQVTSRHLRRKFKEKVGMGPKYYLRICRFHRALQLNHQYPQIDLQDLSFQCGYYDHSHFIKDFKQFSGKSPYDYLINNNRNLEVGGFL